MSIDIANLSAAELRALRADIDRSIEQKAKTELAQLRAEIVAIINSRGYTLQQVIDYSPNKTGHSSFVRGKTYSDPANPGQIWECTGSRPQWVRDLLAKGGTLIEVAQPSA